MNQTLAEKVMSRLCGRPVVAGSFVELQPDWTFSLDDGIGLLDRYFRANGISKLANPEKIAVFYDHYAPADTPLHAHIQRMGRKMVRDMGIPHLFEVGEGISHQIAVESRLVQPGQMVVNTDSHTCTVGAVGAVGCGIGAAEMAYLWAHGSLWFRVPESIRIELSGSRHRHVTAKDVVLHILAKLSSRGAIYASIEFHGDGLAGLNIAERMTLCNMAAEMGAKCASVPFDSITAAHFAKAELSVPADLAVPDTDATYARNYLFALEDVEPMISTPGRVDNVEPVSSLVGTRVDQIFLGTCSNGRYEDLSVAADILRDKKLAPGVRMIVSPASREVLQQALASDVARVLVDAGCSITTPGCGSCAGIHQGVLAEDEVCLATAPRNFVGRMGHKDARIYLASPATVAASALAGQVTDPREVTDN